jgi:hypothetical protein
VLASWLIQSCDCAKCRCLARHAALTALTEISGNQRCAAMVSEVLAKEAGDLKGMIPYRGGQLLLVKSSSSEAIVRGMLLKVSLRCHRCGPNVGVSKAMLRRSNNINPDKRHNPTSG